MTKRGALEYLREMDEKHRAKHGALLFRRSAKPNGKLWVDIAVLAKIRPDKFAELTEVSAMVAINSRLEALEDEVEDIKRERKPRR